MDEALLPYVQGQSYSTTIVRLGLQHGELLAAVGLAPLCEALVADNVTREAREDRGQADAARETRNVPTGGGGCHAELVQSDP